MQVRIDNSEVSDVLDIIFHLITNKYPYFHTPYFLKTAIFAVSISSDSIDFLHIKFARHIIPP